MILLHLLKLHIDKLLRVVAGTVDSENKQQDDQGIEDQVTYGILFLLHKVGKKHAALIALKIHEKHQEKCGQDHGDFNAAQIQLFKNAGCEPGTDPGGKQAPDISECGSKTAGTEKDPGKRYLQEGGQPGRGSLFPFWRRSASAME